VLDDDFEWLDLVKVFVFTIALFAIVNAINGGPIFNSTFISGIVIAVVVLFGGVWVARRATRGRRHSATEPPRSEPPDH
jgi:hypothetical protein